MFGCRGPVLTRSERQFFEDVNPAGFILFRRNIETPAQLRRLVGDLRETLSHATPVFMTDQEGGRVQRLGPPYWPRRPAMRPFGIRAVTDPSRASEMVRLNAQLIAADLSACGINVNCAPVLDLLLPEGHDVVGDRAFSSDPETVAGLGRAVCEGLLAGGVMPVVKHCPGHGRAEVDSHMSTPRVSNPLDVLRRTDFAPFSALRDSPAAMTAHVVYEAVDPVRPASLSHAVIQDIIRTDIGFDGLLFSDDICMEALEGPLERRAADALEAGSDIVLHCNGDLTGMEATIEGCSEMTPAAMSRLERARSVAVKYAGIMDSAQATRQVSEFLEDRVGSD